MNIYVSADAWIVSESGMIGIGDSSGGAADEDDFVLGEIKEKHRGSDEETWDK